MRHRTVDQWRDLVVRQLARVSLLVVLAVLGALFVGGAATSQAASDRAAESSVLSGDRIRPAGLVLGAAVIGGGLVVLVIGAFRPPRSSERGEYADLTGT
ncbi:hypothetical protein [Nocardioides dilutus]